MCSIWERKRNSVLYGAGNRGRRWRGRLEWRIHRWRQNFGTSIRCAVRLPWAEGSIGCLHLRSVRFIEGKLGRAGEGRNPALGGLFAVWAVSAGKARRKRRRSRIPVEVCRKVHTSCKLSRKACKFCHRESGPAFFLPGIRWRSSNTNLSLQRAEKTWLGNFISRPRAR